MALACMAFGPVVFVPRVNAALEELNSDLALSVRVTMLD